MFPKIVQVIPTAEYTVYVYFDDGKIVCYDVKPMLSKKVFAPLADVQFFMETCTVMNGTLAWDVTKDRNPQTCIDIDPDTLYGLDSVKELIA